MKAPSVNLYDFDHTIYDGDASFDFIVYCLVRRPKLWKYLPYQFFALLRYIVGLWTRKQVKQTAFAFLQDIPDIDTIVQKFWQTHEHNIKPWYTAHHKDSDIVISASPKFLLTPVAQKLGVGTLLATNMNKYTGKITGKNCRGKEKLRRLQDYDKSLTINACYSDSVSDLPLLELAMHPYIVKKHTLIPLADYKPSRFKLFKSPTFIRFLFVGGVNALLGILFAYTISFFVASALLAWITGYSLGLVVSYPLNSAVTFRTFSLSLKQFGSFCLSYIPNFLVQFVCVHILVDRLGLYRLAAYVLSVIVAVPITFLLLSGFTFRKD